MKLLILGGSRFLGWHLADQALQRGHTVTLLNRGRSGQGVFPQAEHLRADRDLDRDLEVLRGRRWDAVVDTCAYRPAQVRRVAERLAGQVGLYQMVSSISAYAALDRPGQHEDGALAVLDDPSTETVDDATYGGLKALCEAAAIEGFGAAACCLPRPGLLVGPKDPTGRWSWWIERVAAGGEILAPGDPEAPVQFIDARDAAAWMLDRAERAGEGTSSGAFNLTGPAEGLTWGAFLESLCRAFPGPARLTWVDEGFVARQGLAPWTDLPVWLPSSLQALHQVRLDRARATGLRTRPLAESVRDTWSSLRPRAGPAGSAAPGLSAEREAQVLQAWHRHLAA